MSLSPPQVANLDGRLNSISINLGNHQQQIQNNFDTLSSSIANTSDLPKKLNILNDRLNDISINLGDSNQQTQNNFDSINEKAEIIPDLTHQVKDLTKQIEGLTDKLKKSIINQGNFQEQTQKNFNLLSDLEKNIDSKFNETKQILNQIKPHKYELIYGRPNIRAKLRKSLKEANQNLIMVCPWVSQNAVDPYIQQDIQETLNRNQGVKIHIGWGNLYDIEKSGIQSLQDLLTNNAISIFQKFERIQLKLLGTHEKFLICDDKWALITSYNFLSASDFRREREIALLTYDKNIIADLINHYENSPSL